MSRILTSSYQIRLIRGRSRLILNYNFMKSLLPYLLQRGSKFTFTLSRPLFKAILLALCFGVSAPGWAQSWMSSMQNNPNPNFFEIQQAFYQYWQDRPIQKGKGYKPFKRWEWYWQKRVNPDGTFPDPAQIVAGIDEYNQLANNTANRSVMMPTWTSLGPSSTNGGYAGLGRIQSIAFDPNNSNIIWVGSPGGGLWKTTDGGTSWTAMGDQLTILGVSGIVITPSNPNIMYLATGSGDSYETRSIGVLKSTDGGVTWNATGLVFSQSSYTVIRKLLMDPNDENHLIAATSNGLRRTTDGGTTWSNVQSGDFFDVEAQPGAASNNFYASTASQIYRSTNNGSTWTSVQTISGSGRIALGVSNADNTVVVALCSDASSSGFLGLYRSTNSGASYTLQSSTPNLLGYEADGSDSGGQGWYDLVVTLDPTNASIVFVGGVTNWKSTDGGVNWTHITHWYNLPPYAEGARAPSCRRTR